MEKPPLEGTAFVSRREWDSNPRTGYPMTAFRVRLVMTTSISLPVFLLLLFYESEGYDTIIKHFCQM